MQASAQPNVGPMQGTGVDLPRLLRSVARRLRDRGARMTEPRRVVLTVMASDPRHLTADEIATRVLDIDASVHPSSVRRTLEVMTQLGVVQAVALAHGAAVFHLTDAGSRGAQAVDDGAGPAGPAGPHCHAQCRTCGSIVDLPPGLLDEVSETVHRMSGFMVDARGVALSGWCHGCAAGGSGGQLATAPAPG